MKFTMDIPTGDITPGEFQIGAAVAEMARAMDQAGIDACYLTDHPAPDATWLHANGHDALDPFSTLAFIAANTERLMLHTNIVVMAYRNPFLTAKAAATIQVLSGGRLILGAGAGYQKGEFDALGVDFHKRGKLFDEALETIRMAWGGGAVVKEGMNFNAAGNEPRPIPSPQPPIWIGGGSPAAVKRAALRGDGWSPFFAAPSMTAANQESGIHTVEQLGENIQRVHEMRADAGRTGPFDVVIGAKAKIRELNAETAERYIAAVHDVAAVGVTWAMVEVPQTSRQQFLESVDWFGREISAKLKG
jgi:probable F420-dependent oxidoreductase